MQRCSIAMEKLEKYPYFCNMLLANVTDFIRFATYCNGLCFRIGSILLIKVLLFMLNVMKPNLPQAF